MKPLLCIALFCLATLGCQRPAPSSSQDSTQDKTIAGFEKTSIKKSFEERLDILRPCYDELLTRNAKAEGTVSTRFLINTKGEMQHLHIDESTINDKTLHDCILEKLEGSSFPAPENGPVEVIFPVTFQQGSVENLKVNQTKSQ